jgi:hypothetical protein
VAENLDRATPAAAAEAWLVVSDALLRGLNHALSNRAATVGAVSGVLDPAEPPSAAIVDVLRDEAARLDELLQLARLLPGQRAGTEPVHLPDVVPAADDPAVPREDAEPGDEEAMLAAARTLLAASDAVVERRPAAQGARYELTLPTLTAARRAERARRIGLAPSERLGQ